MSDICVAVVDRSCTSPETTRVTRVVAHTTAGWHCHLILTDRGRGTNINCHMPIAREPLANNTRINKIQYQCLESLKSIFLQILYEMTW